MATGGHGFLSYQDTRGEVDYLGKILSAIENYLDKREKKEKVQDDEIKEVFVQELQNQLPASQTPLLSGGRSPTAKGILAGSALSQLVGGDQRAVPGSMATSPKIGGGALSNMGFGGNRLKPEVFAADQIVDISATTLGVERDYGGDMFTKRLNPIDGGGSGEGEVVQAIDRLTFVTMSLVAATKEQTRQQIMIASHQEQTAEKLAAQAKASSEESALEMGRDFSGNNPYEKSLFNSGGLTGSGGGSGGGGGMFGAKVIGQSIGKRGLGRAATRAGAVAGGKLAGKAGMKAGAKLGAKAGASLLGKSLAKKIPGLGLAIGTGLALKRFNEGKPIQGLLEFASGAASMFPGIGTAVSLGLDGVIAGRDMGLIPFAEGGIPQGRNVPALLNDRKDRVKEAVIPLNKKTFVNFGEGILDAQKRNKRDFAKLQAEGMTQYYEKQNGWGKWWEGFKEFLSKLPVIGHLFRDGSDPNNPSGGGGGVRGGVNAANIAADTAEEKAFIATVRETEGTAGAQGYNTVYGGAVVPELTQMTLRELYDATKLGGTDRLPERLGGGVISFKKDQHNSSASGALQLMPETLKGMVNRGEFSWDDTFDPETQNRMILTLARNGGVDIENITPAQLDKASAIWAGLAGTYYGQTSRTAEDSFGIYQQNLREAKTQAPTPDPSDDRRQIDASQRISQNFGRRAKQSISFVHNGQDFHAVKTTNGWDIYKGRGGIFGGTRVDTSGGKNKGVVDSFLEQAESGGGYRVPDGSQPSLEEDLERLSSTGDQSSTVNARSSELAMADISGGSGGTIINNFYGTGGSGSGGGAPSTVPIAGGSESTATQLYHTLSILNA
jgi:hypothetical protein